MHKLLLLCSSIIFSPMINGMDQHPAPSNFALIFNESLTKEINEVIFNHAIISIHEELYPAAKIISALAQVNKAINHHINDKKNCLTCIKTLAQRFNTSHINVCAQIQIPAARQRFLIQNQLFFMCVAEMLDKKTANILIREEVDFNFTHNEAGNLPINTISKYSQQSKDLIFWLLDNGTDIARIPRTLNINARLITAIFSSHNVEQIYKCLNHPSFETQLNSGWHRLKTTLLTIFLDSNIPVLDVTTLNTITHTLLEYGADAYFKEYKNRSALYYSTITYKDQKTGSIITKVNAPLHSRKLCDKLEIWLTENKRKEYALTLPIHQRWRQCLVPVNKTTV